MNISVARWGNSFAVRLPKAMIERMHLYEGAVLELEEDSGRLVLTPKGGKLSLEQLVSGITNENRHGEADWGKSQGQETLDEWDT